MVVMKRNILHYLLLLFFFSHYVGGMAQSRIIHLGLQQGMSNGYVLDMAQDQQGRVWMATQGGLHCWDGYRFTVYDTENSPLTSNELNTVLPDKDGIHLWVGTRRDGLFCLNTQTGEWNVLTSHDGLASNGVTRLHYASDGGFWVACYQRGVNHLAIDDTLKFYTDYNVKGLLPPNWTALDDGHGYLYIGHLNEGLSRVDLQSLSLENYRWNDIVGLTDEQQKQNDVFYLCWSPDSMLWAATMKGVAVFSPREKRFVRFIPTESNVTFILCRKNGQMMWGEYNKGEYALMEDRYGNLWKSDGHHGITVECHEQPLFAPYDTLFSSPVVAGLNDIKDTCRIGSTLYIATFEGLWKQTENGQLTKCEELNSLMDTELTNCLATDRQGKLWVGTFALGYFVFTPDGRLVAHSLEPSPDINMLMCDSHGRMWMAHRQGLTLFADTRHPEQMQHYNRANGLKNSFVWAVCEDKKGHIWMSSNGGISCLYPDGGKILNYAHAEGVPYNAFMERQCNRLPDGRIVFGQEEGACVFDPARTEQMPSLSPVYVSSFKLIRTNPETGIDEYIDVPLSEVEDGSFAHDENSFQIAFGVADVAQASAVELQYCIEGRDSKWYDVGRDGIMTVQNISPGHYTLLVRARLSNTEWSDVLIELPFTVRQPWWWTWWMRLLYIVVLVAFLLYQWHLYQQRQQLRRRLTERLAAMYAQTDISEPRSPAPVQRKGDTIEENESLSHQAQGENEDANDGEESFHSEGEEDEASIASSDRAFLQRLDAAILSHLTDSDFDMSILTDTLCMSQSTLYRRTKDLTGMSTSEYIRRHRLAKAMQLLREGHSVSEVSFLCGFNSPKYFSRRFKDEYGLSPSEV